MKGNPFGDYDKDGIKNVVDCEPKNPKKDSILALATMVSMLQTTIAVGNQTGVTKIGKKTKPVEVKLFTKLKTIF